MGGGGGKGPWKCVIRHKKIHRYIYVCIYIYTHGPIQRSWASTVKRILYYRALNKQQHRVEVHNMGNDIGPCSA